MQALKITMASGFTFVYPVAQQYQIVTVELINLPDVKPKPPAPVLPILDLLNNTPLSADDAAAIGIQLP